MTFVPTFNLTPFLDRNLRQAVIATFLLAALSRAKASVVRSMRTDVMTIDDVLALLRNVTRLLRDWIWEEKPQTRTNQARLWHVVPSTTHSH